MFYHAVTVLAVFIKKSLITDVNPICNLDVKAKRQKYRECD